MKKKLILFFVGLSLFLGVVSPVLAADLIITCDNDGCGKDNDLSLFSEEDIYPGWETSRVIEAVNNYPEDRQFALEVNNFSQSGELGGVLEIEVKEVGGTTFYSGDLVGFSNQGYQILSTVSWGSSKEYQLSVYLPTWVGNDYQDKRASFDLSLGFEMVEVNGDNGVDGQVLSTSTSDGGGGGGPAICTDTIPGAAPILSLVNEGVNSVELTWTSVSPVTHYMIRYGLSSGNYPYGAADVGNVLGKVIEGLSAGRTYYFQVAGVNGCQPGPWSNEVSAFPSGAVFGGEVPPPAEGFEEAVLGEKEEGQIGGAGATTSGEVKGGSSFKKCFWWLVFGLLALIINTLYVYQHREELREKKRLWFWPALFGLLAFIGDRFSHGWYEPSKWCPWMWLWSLLTVALPYLLWQKKWRD